MSAWSDAPLVDAAQIESYREILAPEQVTGLIDAFDRELATRPGEISALLSRDDVDGARASAHRLRGAALSIGACRVAALADALEHSAATALSPLAEALLTCACETSAAMVVVTTPVRVPG